MPAALTAESLIAAAEAATGLSSWGDQDFRRGLDLLLDEAQRSARLSERGRARLVRRVDGLLQNRLRMMDWRQRHPEVAAGRIERPIFILGLPRSGTSNLLSLLASDPAHRVPRLWEIYRSVPPPQTASYTSDPRIEDVRQQLVADGFDSEELQATHPFDAQLPEECGFIFEHTFACMVFPAYMHLPELAHYAMNEADWRGVYGFHRQFLQHLQSGHRGDRWVLKTPEHAHFIPELLATYPDAILLYTHRAPSAVMSSLASNITALRQLWSDDVDPRQVAATFLAAEAEGTRRMVEARRDPAVNAHFHDILFEDLIQRPLETMERLYARFDLPFDDAAQQGLRHYVENEAKKTHGHGRHAHTLDDYGYTEAEINEAFAPYLEWFNAGRDAMQLGAQS